jgi:hypothetical protein
VDDPAEQRDRADVLTEDRHGMAREVVGRAICVTAGGQGAVGRNGDDPVGDEATINVEQ